MMFELLLKVMARAREIPRLNTPSPRCQFILLSDTAFEVSTLQSSNRCSTPCQNQTVPYGTDLLGWGSPRHFVPGYDRIVPCLSQMC